MITVEFSISGTSDKKHIGCCLQRNLKMNLPQFHLTYQRCTFRKEVITLDWEILILASFKRQLIVLKNLKENV